MSRSTGSIPSYIAKRRPQPEKPFRNELLNVERLQEHARVLGAELVDATPRVRAKPILQRLDDNDRRLLTVYRELATDLRSGQPITPAAEWLLDNYHLVAAETGAIRANLPKRYFDELPVSAGREVRIYVLARELLRHSDSRLDGHQLTQFLLAFQSVTPLTLGELWAWPSMLKLLLVENLRRLADQMSFVRAARLAADEYVTYVESGGSRPPAWSEPADTAFVVQLLHRIREEGPRLQLVQHHVNTYLAAHDLASEDVVRQEHQQQAVDQVSVANVVASLRVCASLDWGVFVESVSHVDQVLRRDPAGVYATMDFHSRDAQRRAVEDLAGQTGTDQVQVALRAVESARSAAAQAAASDRSAHVGYYLVGAGRPLLEADIAYTPRIGRRLRHALSNHPTFVYLGAISTLTGLLVALVVMGVSVAPSPWLLTVAALLTIAPASDIAIALVHRVVAHLVTPTRLPRLELKEGVPASARTMVIVPTLLTSVQQVESLLDQLEVIAIGNLEDNVHFAVLSDFADAPEGARDNDADVLTAAQDGIEALNRRYAPDAQDRFFLFHRERQWNARERTWMGWERKRGKIEEFNRLLRGATDTSYTVQIGALALLPSVRYCLTLDSDTRLPRDSARTLIGIASHPLHQPRVDATLGRVVEGYGVLQPRVSVTMASAAGSLFARTYAGYTGVDPYTTAVSDLYQDLFGEGIYTGKGLYDVDAFTAALEGRVPHNALLSHDLFEGLHVRTALATDVEVVDDYPTSLLAHSRRQHRWVRGDWQILWWLLPYVPTRDGIDRNRLPLISRWKILDNLRRSLFAPSLLALIAAGWTLLPGRPAYWTLVALAPLVWPTMLSVVEAGISTPRPWRAWLGRVLEALRIGAARSTLQLVFLAEDAAAMTHAIALTLTRILITKARLLEWETAADSAAKAETLDLPSFYWAMRASPAIAAALVAAVSIARPSAFVLAAPIAASWALAPLLGYWLSQPIVVQRSAIGAESLALMREIATRTWRFFETFVGEEDHHLPPDTVQLRPEQQVAHRTSPTNIGMYLLSTLAAHDLGLFGLADLEARVDATLTTVERLQRFEGHLLNWYDTRTLQPLRPAYVSTVDSGNLAGSLITLAEGLKELAAGRTGLSAERDRLVHLASRASALADGMNFKFLYDAPRHLFFIGFRLPDADGPGQHDLSHYDLLASEARLASFVAIAKGDVPQRHWFHLGRAVTSQAGQPVLVSWSATLCCQDLQEIAVPRGARMVRPAMTEL